MKNSTLRLVLACIMAILACVSASTTCAPNDGLSLCTDNDNSGCSASVSVTARAGASWTADGVSYQQYDISISNVGTSSINDILAIFGSEHGEAGYWTYIGTDEMTQSLAWNYNVANGEISGFGPALLPGQSFTGAGFTISGGSSPSLAAAQLTCPGSSATSAPTSAPTQGATSAPTHGATVAPGTCSASVLAIKRTYTTGSFNEWVNGQQYPAQIWDLTITNTGSKAISSLSLSISPAAGTSVNNNNMWNMQYTSSNLYSVSLYGALSASSAAYYGAGFVIDGATSSAPAVAIASVQC